MNSRKLGSSKAIKAKVLLFDNDGFSDYTCYLARGLARYQMVTMYSFSEESCRITGALNEKTIKFVQIEKKMPKGRSAAKGIIRVFILFFILLSALTRTKYDVVHIQNYLPTFFLFVPILKLRRKAILWELHDLDLHSLWYNLFATGINGRLQVLFQKLVSQPTFMTKYADKIIVHASSLRKKLIEKNVSENKIHVIPHLDYQYLLELKDSVDFKSLESIFDDEYILFFGNLAPWKGVDTLIDAFRIIKNRMGQKFNLLIAGKPYRGFEHLKFFDLNDEEKRSIRMITKYITGSEITVLVDKASFLVLPYKQPFQYSTSGVIPLAYTFAKPVIVSNVPSLAEYVEVGVTGLIFDINNSEQLADCMIELLENKEKCIEMGRRAHQKIVNEMSLDVCSKAIIDIYKSLKYCV